MATGSFVGRSIFMRVIDREEPVMLFQGGSWSFLVGFPGREGLGICCAEREQQSFFSHFSIKRNSVFTGENYQG